MTPVPEGTPPMVMLPAKPAVRMPVVQEPSEIASLHLAIAARDARIAQLEDQLRSLGVEPNV